MRRNKAFTLIELLIVIAIIGILATLVIVFISGANLRAKDTAIKSNMVSLKSALEKFKVDKGKYPDVWVSTYDGSTNLLSLSRRTLADELSLQLAPYFGAGANSKVFDSIYLTENIGGPLSASYGTNKGVNSNYVMGAGLFSKAGSSYVGSFNTLPASGNGTYETYNVGRREANATYTSCSVVAGGTEGVCIYNNGVAISIQTQTNSNYNFTKVNSHSERAYILYGPE